ncbi:MAG: hypothetical protein KDA59_13855 [Planctomycetales bacterium]|nr:hypothetical protein [Planctomycetales bacterium]
MSLPNWQDELAGRLLAEGLPLVYVRRTVREMADHYDELLGERIASDEALRTLGEPEVLASSITRDYRHRTWLGRHAWVVFWLLPLPIATFIAYLVYILTIEAVMPCVIWACGVTEESFVLGPLETWKIAIVLVMHLVILALPIAMAVATYRWLAIRLGQPWTRQLPALGLLTFYFAVTMIELTWPASDTPGNYRIDIGTFDGFAKQPVSQLLQTTFAVLLGAGMVWQAANRRLGRASPEHCDVASS